MTLRFFKIEEFACRCGRSKCDAPAPDMTLVMKLDGLRLEFGEAMPISSGCRCAYWNAVVGGEKDSQHLIGKAADIPCISGNYAMHLVRLAIKAGFTGIGVGKNFVHLDVRPGTPVLFGYDL